MCVHRTDQMNFNITRLARSDLNEVIELLHCFGRCFEDPETYCEQQPSKEYLESVLDNPSNIVLVAKDGTKVIGGLVAYELKKLEQPRSELYIYDLAVDEEYRQKGVATSLIKALQPIANDLRAWVIYVQADYVDAPAVALYSNLGEKEEVLHFDIPVVKVSTGA